MSSAVLSLCITFETNPHLLSAAGESPPCHCRPIGQGSATMARMRKIYCAVIVRVCARSLPLPIGKSTTLIRRCKGKASSCCCLIVQGSCCSPHWHFVWWFIAILVRQSSLIASHEIHICRRQKSRAMGEMYFTECHSQAMTLSFAMLSSEICPEKNGIFIIFSTHQ